MRRTLLLVLAGAVSPVGCEGSALGTHEHLPSLRSSLEPFGLTPTAAPTKVTDLQWKAPDACLQSYQILVDYEPDIAFEPDSSSVLVLGPPAKARADNPPPGAWMTADDVFMGQAYFLGLRAESTGVFRDWYLSGAFAGPAAPTAACWPQTWDPIEDALGLGWPRLPVRLTAVDETWTGLRVEAKCNRGACIDPKTGGGGPDTHDLSCVTMSWRNELAGVYEISGQQLALIASDWTDGQTDDGGRNIGLWSERRVLFSLDAGRPVWAEFVLHHSYAQPLANKGSGPITRRWTMRSIDECPGSLAALGWERTADARAAHEEGIARYEAGDPRKKRKRKKGDPDDEDRPSPSTPPVE